LTGSSGLHVGIVTASEDLHAHIISAELRARGHEVSMVLSDRMPGCGGLSWNSDRPTSGLVRTASGRRIAPADLDVTWWRRAGNTLVPERVVDNQARQYVGAAGSAAASGLWRTTMRGRWVSDPDATRNAENKIVQLRAAIDAGLAVPRTLISQDPDDIRDFAASLGRQRMIAKAVTAIRDLGLAAGIVTDAMLRDDAALAVTPTIYQELVPGTRHLRVCCFGRRVVAASIDAQQLDWRYERGTRIRPYLTEPDLDRRLVDVTKQLGLRMGIFDLKLGPDEEPVWLEINPQGQFLFLEALGGPPLAEAMVDLLVEEGSKSAGGRSDDSPSFDET
jgi:hypothetical protein